MKYIVENRFGFARDFIGVDVVSIPSGPLDIVGFNLGEKHIDFLLKNDLIAPVGDVTDVMKEIKELAESKEEEGSVEFEIDNSPETIVLKAIEEANAMTRRANLDEWASEKHGIELDAGDKLPDMKEQFETKIKKKMLSEDIENKMITGLENK